MILHYIPLTKVARRLLGKKVFKGNCIRVLRFNILIENQEPERLVAATRLFGSKLPRHEQTTCSRQVEMKVHAEWQVYKYAATQAMLASIWDFGECTVSPSLCVLIMY